jgi:hypothetical protein
MNAAICWSLIKVFAVNAGALRRYQRHGYDIVEPRQTVASDWRPTDSRRTVTSPNDG